MGKRSVSLCSLSAVCFHFLSFFLSFRPYPFLLSLLSSFALLEAIWNTWAKDVIIIWKNNFNKYLQFSLGDPGTWTRRSCLFLFGIFCKAHVYSWGVPRRQTGNSRGELLFLLLPSFSRRPPPPPPLIHPFPSTKRGRAHCSIWDNCREVSLPWPFKSQHRTAAGQIYQRPRSPFLHPFRSN